MSINASRFYGIGLTLVAVGAFAACSSDNTDTTNTTGGTGTSHAGTLGLAGSVGTAGTGTGGTGSGTAGATTGGTGSGTAGSGTAGSGTAGSGGAGAGFACAGMKPAAALITDFADLTADAMTAGNFKFALGLGGGAFPYEKPAITLSDASMALNAKGMVAAYDGFGVYFTNCTDGSAFTGVSFSIKGSVGTKNMLSFRVQSAINTKVDAVNKKGQCVGTTYEMCHDATFDIPVTADAKVVEVKFSQLAGGLPSATITGKDILGLEWAFPYNTGDAAYAADVTVDDIKFTGGTPGGGTGGGGAGGGGAGGGGAGGTAGTGGTQ